MALFGHHTQSYLGVAIEINDQPFPDGMTDHFLALGGLLLMAYGLFALVRDVFRWRQRRQAAE